MNTLTSLLCHWAEERPDSVAYRFLPDDETSPVTLTYEGLYQSARAIAAQIQGRGAGGTPVPLLFEAGLEFLEAFFGTLLAGAIPVPCAPITRSGASDCVAHIATDCQATLMLTSAGQKTLLERHSCAPPALTVCTPEKHGGAPIGTLVKARGEDVALLQYTSGTTQRPRGVVLTHENIITNEGMIQRAFAHEKGLQVAGWLPHFHDMGLIGNMLQTLFLGGTLTFLSPSAFVRRPERWLRAISDYGAHTAGGPTFAYQLCAERAPRDRADLDLSSWRVAFVGAESVIPATLRRFGAAFRECGFDQRAFLPCYGLAEASLLVTAAAPDGGFELSRHQTMRADSVRCGPVVPPLELVIADPNTREALGEGTIGEVWVRGASIARGYHRVPPADGDAFDSVLADGCQGFLRTGDLGYLQDGELVVTGRLKNLIIFAGQNYPAEDLEATAFAQGASTIVNAAALAHAHDRAERLVMLCEIRRGLLSESEEAALGRQIYDALVRAHGIPVEAVVLVKARSLPRTTSGKLRRTDCLAAYQEGTLRERSRYQPLEEHPRDPHQDLEQWLRSEIAARCDQHPNSIDELAPFPALGLDSVDLMAIATRLSERLGWEIEETTFWQHPCLASLLEYCERPPASDDAAARVSA